MTTGDRAIASCFKSYVSKTSDCKWYIYTPQGEHLEATDWYTAMAIANRHAREAQLAALR